jgi:hypothetical protein
MKALQLFKAQMFNLNYVQVDRTAAQAHWVKCCEAVGMSFWTDNFATLARMKATAGICGHRAGSFSRHALRERVIRKRISKS